MSCYSLPFDRFSNKLIKNKIFITKKKLLNKNTNSTIFRNKNKNVETKFTSILIF